MKDTILTDSIFAVFVLITSLVLIGIDNDVVTYGTGIGDYFATLGIWMIFIPLTLAYPIARFFKSKTAKIIRIILVILMILDLLFTVLDPQFSLNL
jgi:hypothetical protein